MRRAALSALLLAAALVLQLTVVNRLRLPGGGTPDLVLLVVIALALCGGPQAGMIGGFCGGLSLDLAPPASQLIGQYALVFCVVGYGCGRLRGTLRRSALLPLVLAAAAALAGEALSAGVGLALDPAQVAWATVRQVLPFSALYDVVISSPVLYLVMLASRWADDRAGDGLLERRPAGGSALLARASAVSFTAAGSWRPAAPRLRPAAPRLRSGAGVAGSAARIQPARAQLSRTQPAGSHHPVRFRPGRARRASAYQPARRQPGRPVNLRLAAGRRPDGRVSSAARRAAGAAAARRTMPRIAFSGRGGRGSITGWPRGSGHGTFRPAAARPARSPGFRPAAGARGGSAADGGPRGPAAVRPARLHLRLGLRLRRRRRGARYRDGVTGGGRRSWRTLSRRRRRPAVAAKFGTGWPARLGRGRLGRSGRGRLGRSAPRRLGRSGVGRLGKFGPRRLGRSGRGRLGRSGPRRPVRFRSGRGSVLPSVRPGRAGRRAGAGRIGSRRTGGSR